MLVVLTVNSCSGEKLVASNEEYLDAAVAVSFQKLSDVSFFTDRNINSNAGIFFFERRVLANLAIERQNQTDLVAAAAQFVRQSVHGIDQRTRPL